MNLAALTANLPQGDQLRGAVLRAEVMLLRVNSALESRRNGDAVICARDLRELKAARVALLAVVGGDGKENHKKGLQM